MVNEQNVPRVLIAYIGAALTALVIGYALATPMSIFSLAIVGVTLLALTVPVLMKWHYFLLVLTLNSTFILPLWGQPALGIAMGCVSLFISLLNRTVRHDTRFVEVRCVALPLLLIVAVVLVTAVITGGFGGRAFGSETFGAKRYLGVFGGVIAYFALVGQRIPKERAPLYVAMFFLSTVTAVCSDLIYAAGPSLYFLFALFPPEVAYLQAVGQSAFLRFTGLAWASQTAFYYMLARYGIRGVCEWRQAWRAGLTLLLAAIALLGGYRSSIIVMTLLFVLLFYWEGLFRSRLFPILCVVGVLMSALVVGFLDQMPLSIQRSLSFLPIEVDPRARMDAESTFDWRWQMWKVVIPDVPKYLLLGKGYAFSGTDFLLTKMAIEQGYYSSFDDTLISGNYHNGILTLIIPFGAAGMLAFLWFCASSLWVLHRNYRFGDPDLRRINTFLLAYFAARLAFYLTIYGQFDMDLLIFTGAVGLSLALNGGVAKASAQPAPTLAHG